MGWGKARWLPAPYVPDFTRGLDHFCIHAGGRAVIEGVQRNLGLTAAHVEPSFRTLEEYGNTSSSSIWYELERIEQAEEEANKTEENPSKAAILAAGHRVLQVAFGSGFKCNAAVWL